MTLVGTLPAQAKTTTYHRIQIAPSLHGPARFLEALGDRAGDPVGLQASRPTDPRQQWAVVYPEWPAAPTTTTSPPPPGVYRYKFVNRYSGRCLAVTSVTVPRTVGIADCPTTATRPQIATLSLPGSANNVPFPRGRPGQSSAGVRLRFPFNSPGCVHPVSPQALLSSRLQMASCTTAYYQRFGFSFAATVSCNAAGPVFQCGLPRQGVGP